MARPISVSTTEALTSSSSSSRTARTAARSSGTLMASSARSISGSSGGTRWRRWRRRPLTVPTGAHALRRRRRVAVAERAWQAFADRNPATVVHSPRSTDFTNLCSAASNTTSCASRLRCFRLVPVVDPGRFARGISSVSIAHAQHGVGSSSIARLPARIADVACRKLVDTSGASRRDSEPGLTRSQHRARIAHDTVREWRATRRVPNRHTFTSDTRRATLSWPSDSR